jgi:hypothetical protein
MLGPFRFLGGVKEAPKLGPFLGFTVPEALYDIPGSPSLTSYVTYRMRIGTFLKHHL